MPLRRAGTVANDSAWYGPGSAAHHAVKNGVLRCVRGKDQAALRRVSGITSQIMARPVAATAANPKKATLLPNLSVT